MKDKKTNHAAQDDLPYEQRMLCIIRDYRRINEHVDAARRYGETMERENKELKTKIAKLNTLHANDVRNAQDLHRKIKLLKRMLNNMGIQVTRKMLREDGEV